MPFNLNGRGYLDGDFTQATAASLPVFDSTIAATTKPYTFTQQFVQHLDSFRELPLNTRHGAAGTGVWLGTIYPDYFLVDESPLEDALAGIVRWTRTYSKVPDSFSEWEGFAYRFIGFFGQTGINVTQITGREPRTLAVTSRVAHDFFIVSPFVAGQSPIPNPTDNRIYGSPGDIPFIQAQKYIVPLNPGVQTSVNPFFDTDYLADSPPLVTASQPSRTQYMAWVLNAIKYSWAGGLVAQTVFVPPTNSGTITITVEPNPAQIPAEDSRLVRWNGNIYQRTTRYVLAQ